MSNVIAANIKRVALVGSPNVGKSVMFHNLTGVYAVVANYPGTTVEITKGRALLGGEEVEILDTPGLYSLLPITDEERITRRILLEDTPLTRVVHIIDAKNLERMLPLSLQLLECGLPLLLVLNLFDEAKNYGITIDSAKLTKLLSVPVIKTVATKKIGVETLKKALLTGEVPATSGVEAGAGVEPLQVRVDYGEILEGALARLQPFLSPHFLRSSRGLGLLLLQQDPEIHARVRSLVGEANFGAILQICQEAEAALKHPPAYVIALARQRLTQQILKECAVFPRVPVKGVPLAARTAKGSGEPEATSLKPSRGVYWRTLIDKWLGELTINPLTGVPILLLIIYFGLYKFVGVFGANTVVDFIERFFNQHLNPLVNAGLEKLLPGGSAWHYWLKELIGGEYGVVTLGLTYAFAIILPIVFLFFLFFSLLEDTGYFPRLALLVDRLFKGIGLNGRAVIPLILGFGCGAMAALVTRIQETKRERFLATLLLAITIPCSAQYGVITALLSREPRQIAGVSYAFLLWAGILLLMFMAVGKIASVVYRGEAASFYMEVSPLRWPQLTNVLTKTIARLKWYFLEIMPVFLMASVVIWIGRLTHIFDLLLALLKPLVVSWLGLPPEVAPAFLYGFLRRDFGAAGLYQLKDTGQMTGLQTLVAGITLTLFLPCIAQFLVMKQERGLKTATLMALAIVVLAFGVGGLVNWWFLRLGIVL